MKCSFRLPNTCVCCFHLFTPSRNGYSSGTVPYVKAGDWSHFEWKHSDCSTHHNGFWWRWFHFMFC